MVAVSGALRDGSASLVSHWLVHAGGAEPTAVAELPTEAEVVVIGGGILGVAATYWLARRGIDVLLLEATCLGWGATGRNAGLVLAAPTPLEDLSLLRAVLREEAIDAQFEERDHLALAVTPDVLEKMLIEVGRRPATAPPLKVLGRAECEGLLGQRLSPRVLGGRWLRGAAVVHPVRLVRQLAERARRRGAKLAWPVRARSVRHGRHRHTSRVETTRGVVRARSVVVACAAGTPRLLPALRHILKEHRAPMCSTVTVPPIFNMGLAIDWGTYYWRQAADGAVILGGGRVHEDLAGVLPQIFPELRAIPIARRWVGVMDEAPDGRPIVGASAHGHNVWVAAGFGGHGLPPALGVGAALAEWIATGEAAPALRPLDPGRFP
jgi:glycine/D-amino acid oxidase-like deaminating enzyme